MVEAVRLLIWDLDETFWSGTLTEGGITPNPLSKEILITLAQRGIVSSICSKNDHDSVKKILEDWDLWQYFVFPSISWEPKGPRLAALIETIGLRPPTVMFIDDNPMNLNEAKHFVPEIQTADEKFIPSILAHPLFQGKDDRGLTRLAQYKVLETRAAEQQKAGANVHDFLRKSNITVEIETDVEKHLDRAIELINRTNQLNFTKDRLPENIDEARQALRDHLKQFYVQAGLVRVRDNYGDYGFTGLFVQHRGADFHDLSHYCFSCRTLGMGVETWLYRVLGRPKIRVVGEVLADLFDESNPVDWVRLYDPATDQTEYQSKSLGSIFIGGGCDLEAAAHYLSLKADRVHLRLNTARGGMEIRSDHSEIFRLAIEGIDGERLDAMLALGYAREDFIVSREAISGDAGVWVLSFWTDAYYHLYRHRVTGDMTTFSPAQLGHHDVLTFTDAELAGRNLTPEAASALAYLRQNYTHVGLIDETRFKRNARAIIAAAPAGVRVIINLLSETAFPGHEELRERNTRYNDWTRQVAAEFDDVTLISIQDFVKSPDEAQDPLHYNRLVYHRLSEGIAQLVRETGAAKADVVPPPEDHASAERVPEPQGV